MCTFTRWIMLFQDNLTLNTKLLRPINTPEGLSFWSACLLVVSMVVSPFLLSISMWGLAGAALWNVAAKICQEIPGADLKSATIWKQAWQRSFQNLWASKSLTFLSLLLLVPAVSVFWSEDLGYWLRVTQVRIPFLVLPWAFANLPAFQEREHKEVLYLLVWFMVLVCIGVGINFLLHYRQIIENLGHGQPMPVPRQHVRFSLVLATAVIGGAWLWRTRFFFKFAWERKALAVAVVFLFVFIHVLSVRGGLAVLYAAILVAIAWYIQQTKRWALGIVAIISLFLLLWAAVETIPSLRQRVAYMQYDWERYKADDGETYSDAERWISLKVGYRIWQENPMFGTGAGDLENEVIKTTAEDFPDYAETPKLPHNQWIHVMASTGLLGLALSLAGFFAPLFSKRNRKKYLFFIFQVMVFTTFLIECTVENAIGVAWYLFYTLWFLRVDSGR